MSGKVPGFCSAAQSDEVDSTHKSKGTGVTDVLYSVKYRSRTDRSEVTHEP